MARKFKKFIRDKRAITAVLSNLLLTVVAVAAMALATTATYVITTNLRETMSERVIIEDLWFNNSTGSIDVYLRNVGQVAIQISSVYVNHTSQSFAETFQTRNRRTSVAQHFTNLGFRQHILRGYCYDERNACWRLLHSAISAT